MKFLIDGSELMVKLRIFQFKEIIAGQLLTPLTRYSRVKDSSLKIGIDNGCFSGFKELEFTSLLKREYSFRKEIIFVTCPDKVGNAKETLRMYYEYVHLLNGFRIAYVAQDGYDGHPSGIDVLFIGGTTKFKESKEVITICEQGIKENLHIHVGRVNTKNRFVKFNEIGCHTCDGSGISKFDWMLTKLKLDLLIK